MATPAAQPTPQCYTAGNCTLNVRQQPSALSQWSDRPIAQALTFELWLDSPEENATDDSKQLVARGDRTELLAVAAYFQHQTRQTLALASLNAAAAPQQSLQSSPQPSTVPSPQSLTIPRPLGYLQLCDISAVLSQYEQATRTLPVALSTATAQASDNTQSDEGAEATKTESDQAEAGEVISLDAIRRQAPRSPGQRTPQRTAQRTLRRRRRNAGLWASSAAAALFAVGLTSTLWSQNPALREPNVASDTPTSDAQQNEEQFGAALPEPSATDNEASTEKLEANSDDAEIGADADSAASQSAGSPNSQTTSPGAAANRPQTNNPPAGSNTPSPTPAPETSSAEASGETGPATDSDSPTDRAPDAATDAPVQRSTAESSTPSAPPPSAPPSPAPAAEAEVFELPEASRQESRPPVSGGGSRGDVFSPPAVEGSIRPEQRAGQTDGAIPDDEAPGNETPGNDVIVPVPAAPGQPPRSLSNQVSTYFQRRWHAGDIGPITAAPLTYRLELSQTGAVVSFTALDQVSEGYRDRILPTNSPPSFRRPVSPQSSPTETGTLDAASNVSLRVVFRANGTVEVLPF